MDYNKDSITLADCVFLNEFKGKEVVINDGKIAEIIEGDLTNGDK